LFNSNGQPTKANRVFPYQLNREGAIRKSWSAVSPESVTLSAAYRFFGRPACRVIGFAGVL
jgi:hypothetical protein